MAQTLMVQSSEPVMMRSEVFWSVVIQSEWPRSTRHGLLVAVFQMRSVLSYEVLATRSSSKMHTRVTSDAWPRRMRHVPFSTFQMRTVPSLPPLAITG